MKRLPYVVALSLVNVTEASILPSADAVWLTYDCSNLGDNASNSQPHGRYSNAPVN